jgi:hypothetical protein
VFFDPSRFQFSAYRKSDRSVKQKVSDRTIAEVKDLWSFTSTTVTYCKRLGLNAVLLRRKILKFSFRGATAPTGPGPPHCRGFTIALRHTTLCKTPLDEWSARRRDLYLTKPETDIHDSGRIRTRDPSNQAAADPRLSQCGHWDRETLNCSG